MSRRKLKAKAKITQKMLRDGLVERDKSTGDDIRISKRETDFDIRGDMPERSTLFQGGTRLDNKKNIRKNAVYQQHELLCEAENMARNEPFNDSSLPHIKGAISEEKQNGLNVDLWHQTSTPDKRRRMKKWSNKRNKAKNHDKTALETETPLIQQDKQSGDLSFKHERESKAGTANIESPNIIDNKFITPVREPAVLSDNPRDPPKKAKDKFKKQANTVLQHKKSTLKTETKSNLNEPQKVDSPLKFNDNIDEKHENISHKNFNLRNNKSEREALSQVGTSKKIKIKHKKNNVYRANKSSVIQHEPQKTERITDTDDIPTEPQKFVNTPVINEQTTPNDVKVNDTSLIKHERDFNLRNDKTENKFVSQNDKKQDIKRNSQKDNAYHHNKFSVLEHEPQKIETPLMLENKATVNEQPKAEQAVNQSDAPQKIHDNKQNPTIRQRKNTKLKILRNAALLYKPIQKSNLPIIIPNDEKMPLKKDDKQVDEAGEVKVADIKQEKNDGIPTEQESETSDSFTQDNAEEKPKKANIAEESDSEASDTNVETPDFDDFPETQLTHDKPGKLKFTDDEVTPDKLNPKQTRKLAKAEKQFDNASNKLEKTKNKLLAKKKLRSERVFDEEKGKAKQRLYFEKEIKPQDEHLKGSMPLRPVKSAGNALMLNAHRKIYQVEHENVSVKAAHRVEMAGEAVVRSALRHHKTAPYKKVAKLEKQAAKKNVKLIYQKTLAENPRLKSNVLFRMMQKRKIKKQYAKSVREAKKAARVAQKAGSVTARATKFITDAISKNPKVIIIIILFALFILLLMSLFSLGSNIGSGGFGAILSPSYLAEDNDIESAALDYSEWEVDLYYQIINAETTYTDYDEYKYNIGNIGHNPLELMAYLTAVYHDFSYDVIADDLQALFDEQYTLEFTPSAEVRHYTDDDGSLVPYSWNVMTVTLTALPFDELITSKMTASQKQHYDILMQSKGSRQYAGSPFDLNWLPNITSYYGYRVHPISGTKDFHRGIDIALPTGTEIQSAQNGTVTFAEYSGGYGNVVVIENGNGIITKYAHCDTLLVIAGQTVKMGDVIATVGSTGDSTGAHLHFELLKDGEYVNPLYFVHSRE